MHTSTERTLTTHVGSLPRPKDVVDFLFAQDRGDPLDEAFDASLQRAVGEAVGRQAEAGIDIASDGEMSKISCWSRRNRWRCSSRAPTRDTSTNGRSGRATGCLRTRSWCRV